MSRARIASQIAKREGKKSQARIGDIREIMKIMEEMICAEWLEVGSELAVTELESVLLEGAHKKYKKRMTFNRKSVR